MRAEPCTVERLRKLTKDTQKMRDDLYTVQGKERVTGSFGAALAYLDTAETLLTDAYRAYTSAIIDGVVEEEACQ